MDMRFFSVFNIFGIFIISLITLAAPQAQGQERLIKGAPAQLTPLPSVGAPQREDLNLVVTDVMVDKTADTAMQAREQAMTAAQREAFQKLAMKFLTPAEYATFRMPDDRTIAGLVQDFEVKGEQLSSSRYIAKFTVRFRDGVRRYIDIPYDVRQVVPQQAPVWRKLPGDQAAATPAAEDAPAQDADTAEGLVPDQVVPYGQPAAMAQGQGRAAGLPAATSILAGPVLLLPYYESISGRTLLWEEPNPWRDAWQRIPAQDINAQALNKIIVPLGDIADVSAGSADTVWSGDYKTVEKLRTHYGVSQVVLAVANKSGPQMTIDIYVYQGGALKRQNALTPYVGEKAEPDAWHQAIYDVVGYLQRPMPARADVAENVSRSLTQSAAMTEPVADIAPAEAGEAAGEVEAMLSFTDFNAWMSVQRRFSAMTPPVRIDLRSLSRNSARFTIRYAGNVASLQNALAGQGISMAPSREVTTAMGAPIYDLRLHP